MEIDKLLHDLRNPLAAIYTAVSVLRELPPDTPLANVDRHLRLIESAVDRGKDLIAQTEGELDEPTDHAKAPEE